MIWGEHCRLINWLWRGQQLWLDHPKVPTQGGPHMPHAAVCGGREHSCLRGAAAFWRLEQGMLGSKMFLQPGHPSVLKFSSESEGPSRSSWAGPTEHKFGLWSELTLKLFFLFFFSLPILPFPLVLPELMLLSWSSPKLVISHLLLSPWPFVIFWLKNVN